MSSKENRLPDGLELYRGGREVVNEKGSLHGRIFEAEWERKKDSLTGREVIRFTNSAANDQHPYFTGPAMTSDGQQLIFMSERSGSANLYALDWKTGRIVQLTDNRYGVLRSYVYPWGSLAGFGKASVVLNAPTADIYYMQGRELRRVNARTLNHLVIATIPPGYVTSFMHVDHANRRVCVPLIPEAAFAEASEVTIPTYNPRGFFDIERRTRELGLASELLVVNTDGSGAKVWATIPNAWVTHVQFRPGAFNDNLLLFNHEGVGGRAGAQRIWMCDGETGKVWKIRPEPAEQEHWNCHEVWTRNGQEVIYHGTGRHPQTGVGTNLFGWCDITGNKYREVFLRNEEVSGYGHFAEHPEPGKLIGDGYFGDMKLLGKFWDQGDSGWASWEPICRHDSKWIYQDDHPHPIASEDGKWCVFTSSESGTANVYAVRL